MEVGAVEMTFGLPRLKAAGIEISAYEAMKDEIRKQVRALRMAESKISQLEASMEAAKNADIRGAVEAKRRGSKDPGPKNARKVEKELEAAHRERAILDALVAELEAEAHGIVAERQDEIRRGLSEAIRERDEVQLEAVNTIEAARAQRRELRRTLDLIGRLASAPLPEVTGSGRDTFEVSFGPQSWRPNDGEIETVLAWFKAECGSGAELRALQEQAGGTVDISVPPGGGLLPHRVVGYVEERKAARAAGGDDAA